MSSPHAHLLRFLPDPQVGTVESVEPIALGLSGAGVWAVTTSRGAYVLRVQGGEIDEGYFAQQLRVLRRAAEAGIAPALVHVDEAARAVLSVRVQGMPIAGALGDPAQRGAVMASVVDRLRALHSLDSSDVAERDPIPYVRKAWEAARHRPGFPAWATSIGTTIDEIAAVLAQDPRRVVSHNDVNPGNFLWDGTRAWLIDWEVAGLGHPYYDLATLALFLRVEDEAAFGLVALHDGAPPDERSKATFRALRQLAGLLSGLTFLGRVEAAEIRPAPEREDAPTLLECYEGLRSGTMEVQSPLFQVSMGLALLALGVAPRQG